MHLCHISSSLVWYSSGIALVGITFYGLVIATSLCIHHCVQNFVLQVMRAASEMEDDRVVQHESPNGEEVPIPPISAVEETDGE